MISSVPPGNKGGLEVNEVSGQRLGLMIPIRFGLGIDRPFLEENDPVLKVASDPLSDLLVGRTSPLATLSVLVVIENHVLGFAGGFEDTGHWFVPAILIPERAGPVDHTTVQPGRLCFFCQSLADGQPGGLCVLIGEETLVLL